MNFPALSTIIAKMSKELVFRSLETNAYLSRTPNLSLPRPYYLKKQNDDRANFTVINLIGTLLSVELS